MAQEGEPRINTSSTSQSRDSERWSITQNNVPRSFVGTDKHYRHQRKESQNILGKNCCHRIKCTADNSLAALMWRWYLNSGYQPYSYYTRLMKGADGTSINTSHLPCTWRTRMRGEGSIKGGGSNRRGGSKERENYYSIKNWLCNQT